jgi:hypothetical protein
MILLFIQLVIMLGQDFKLSYTHSITKQKQTIAFFSMFTIKRFISSCQKTINIKKAKTFLCDLLLLHFNKKPFLS